MLVEERERANAQVRAVVALVSYRFASSLSSVETYVNLLWPCSSRRQLPS